MTRKIFKTEKGKMQILRKYNELFLAAGLGANRKSVNTAFGETSFIESGFENKETILLLHGSCSNSAMWFGDLPVLAEKYRVIAIDIIGEAGWSEEVRLDLNSDEYALWLESFLNCLGLKRVIIVGNSFGGWLALKFAVNFKDRVTHLVLIASSGIVSPKRAFLFKCIVYLMLGRYGRLLLSRMVFGKKEIPEEVLEYSNLIIDNFNPMVGKLPVLSEKDFCVLKMPLLFIVGENDPTMDVIAAVKRISKVLKAEAKVMNDTAHVITNTAKDIIEFCGKV